ncbi:MFS transporter [Acidipila sp. EB88]|uniref:MFS transporter n=1 Tax=Acidipila sp. EB88 TaxID=2305226 RepID=UPI001F28DD07|nr:MFS transporter [Acidipila sp. EB88]
MAQSAHAGTAPTPAAAPASIPWLGIGAVLIGVSISVLTGQLLSTGLADVRGAMHLSVDQGAWLGAVFNAGQMFTGPMTVYLGGLMGPRRVLLWATPLVFLGSMLAPFAPGVGWLLALTAITGLGAGSFYPLTLTFVGRSLPPRYVLFGVAAYAFDVLASLHVGSFLEGLYMQYLSWHCIFWTASVLSPLMWMLVYFGMPPTTAPGIEQARLRPTWSGFVYASGAFVCFFLLLTQGERLDWFHSGTIVGLAAGGVLLLFASWLRHVLRPNPLVNLRFLFRRNIVLLSGCLCGLRFSLLSSALLVPDFLGGVRSLLPLQAGVVLAWVGIPALLAALLVSRLLLRVDPRLVLATGFTLTASACLWNATLSSEWSRGNFFPGELTIAIGAATTVCGLIGCIVLELVNSGAAKDPIKTLTMVAWFHTVRLFGGQLMTTLLTHLLTVREKFHSNILGQSVSLGSPLVRTQVGAMSHMLLPASPGSQAALGRAGALLGGRVHTQALTLSIADGYTTEALGLIVCLVLIACLGRERLQFRDLAASRGAA